VVARSSKAVPPAPAGYLFPQHLQPGAFSRNTLYVDLRLRIADLPPCVFLPGTTPCLRQRMVASLLAGVSGSSWRPRRPRLCGHAPSRPGWALRGMRVPDRPFPSRRHPASHRRPGTGWLLAQAVGLASLTWRAALRRWDHLGRRPREPPFPGSPSGAGHRRDHLGTLGAQRLQRRLCDAAIRRAA